MSAQPLAQTLEISIHALREEDDVMLPAFFLGMYEFLSAPSARRATARRSSRPQSTRYFYPRPPRGGRPLVRLYSRHRRRFLSTPSARRATAAAAIHGRGLADFYPRPPRGGRRAAGSCLISLWEFLSTPSARRATIDISEFPTNIHISIHALLAEGDLKT